MALVKILKKGSVDRRIPLTIINATTGLPDASLAYNTAGLSLWYRRSGGAKVAITPVTLASLSAAHADGGFLVNSDGDYRLDAPDAAFASGADAVRFGGSATGLIVLPSDVLLTDFDLETALSAGGIADAVLDELTTGHAVPGSVAVLLLAINAGLTTIATQTTPSGIQGSVGLASANLATLLAAIQAAADSVTAKLPSDGAKMAGEGATYANLDDLAAATAGSVAPRRVADSRRWSVGPKGYRSEDVIVVKVGFSGHLEFQIDLNLGADVDSVASVTCVGPIAVTTSELEPTADGLCAQFKVSPLTEAGDYTFTATVTTKDGQTIPVEGLLQAK